MDYRISLKDQPEWSHEEAYEKLIKSFDLEATIRTEEKVDTAGHSATKEAAKAAVKVASDGDDSKTIKWHRFDHALRHFSQSHTGVLGLVSAHKIVRVLLLFYLEVAGVDFSNFTLKTSDTAIAQKFLDDLESRHLISTENARRALFFYIVEDCNANVDTLIFMHRYDLALAVRDGLRTFMFSRSQARIAEFCLITHLGPTEARRHRADKDLFRAVGDGLSVSVGFSISQHYIKRIRATIFPFHSDDDRIEKDLLQLRADGYDRRAEKDRYLVVFFKKETSCVSDEQALGYLRASHWSMEKAVDSYKKMALLQEQALAQSVGFPS